MNLRITVFNILSGHLRFIRVVSDGTRQPHCIQPTEARSFLTTPLKEVARVSALYLAEPRFQLKKRKCFGSFIHRISLFSGIDDEKPLQLKIVQGGVHGLSQGRRIAMLEFKAISAPAPEDQEVQLRAAMGTPEVGIPITGDA